ncbi:hypothetical protein U9M48_002839 [Paspalum notatum var. saurae]|uniref:Uncharacterized protein n=1 Tax=Paspalum notatum var. saurae TaxID=547442 RepID=A0AAQ3PS81_PASNO
MEFRRLREWRDALLVPKVIAGIHHGLHRRQPPVVPHEVPLRPHHPAPERRHAILADHVLAKVQLANASLGLLLTNGCMNAYRPLSHPSAAAAFVPLASQHQLDPYWMLYSTPRRCGYGELVKVLAPPTAPPCGSRIICPPPFRESHCWYRLSHVVGPVQEHLRRHVGAAEGDERHGAQPAHLVAIGRRHAELREDVVHRGDEVRAPAEVERLEEGLPYLQDDPDRQVRHERRLQNDRLPLGEHVGGALVQRLGDVDDRHSRRDLGELQPPRHDDAETLAAASSDGPEEVLAHAGPVEDVAVGIDDLGVHDVVPSDAVLAHHQADAAATDEATNADRRARATWEQEPWVGRADSVVQLAQRRAGVHPRAVLTGDDVEHSEHLGLDGAVGQALVVVPAAAHAEAHAVPAAAAHGSLHVGDVGRRDDAQRPHRGVGHELWVLDGGLQHRHEAARALLKYQLARHHRREALEEGIGRS